MMKPQSRPLSANLLSFPEEILDIIIQQPLLNQADLAHLCRTSRYLARLARNAVFHTAQLKSPEQSQRLFDTLQRDTTQQLGTRVYDLTFQYPRRHCAEKDAIALLPRTPRLHHLTITSAPPQDDPDPFTRVHGPFCDLFSTLEPIGRGANVRNFRTGFLADLRSCSLDFHKPGEEWDEYEMVFFLTHPTLTSLRLRRMRMTIHDFGSLARKRKMPVEQLVGANKITELILDECDPVQFTLERIIQLPRALVRLHVSYKRLGPHLYSWAGERVPRVFQAIEGHRETLEDLRVWEVYMTVTTPVFLHFPKLRKVDFSVGFAGPGVLSEADCVARDWSDLIGKNVEEFTLRSSEAPAFVVGIRPR